MCQVFVKCVSTVSSMCDLSVKCVQVVLSVCMCVSSVDMSV